MFACIFCFISGMDANKTPVSKLRHQDFQQDLNGSFSRSSTDDLSSPIYFPNTQESNDEIDVIWDWNSPQANQRKCPRKRRLIPSQSPARLLVKKQPSFTQEGFARLREELQSIREEIAHLDDEDSVCVSPQQETHFKEEPPPALSQQGYEDFFDDAADEQLDLFSQRLERELQEKHKTVSITLPPVPELDDSFDRIFENIGDVDLDNLQNQSSTVKTSCESLTVTRNVHIEINQSNPRLQCDALTWDSKSNAGTQNLKVHTEFQVKTNSSTIMKCTTEQVEQKRLDALAKLEAKRVQELVERKRLEALRRFQENRQNRVKASVARKF